MKMLGVVYQTRMTTAMIDSGWRRGEGVAMKAGTVKSRRQRKSERDGKI
ncbi:MAG: hypothetical protein OXP69_03215 [Spirochaetaceae bacterium]|nr:hypothetical protein [Spirochaetaceae bacterium]